MKKYILSSLLFHANKSKDKEFYPIKNRILTKYGRKTDTVVQFIDGKKCINCGGTGNHTYFDWNGFAYDNDICWRCNGTGWFKRPRWNWLDIVQFGKYSFHQPFTTTYEAPTENVRVFEGYVEHNVTKFTKISLFIIFLLYEHGYLKRWWYKELHGWRICWWRPQNYIHNLIHLLRHGRNACPFRKRTRIKVEDLPF